MAGKGEKSAQMRAMREANWKAAQEALKRRATTPRIDDTDAGTLDNEPPSTRTHVVETATKQVKEKLQPKVELTRRERALEAMKPRQIDPDEARCPECGRIYAVVRGRISMHQKGLGKKCPGANKEVS